MPSPAHHLKQPAARTDAILLALIRQGDRPAMAELYERYAGRLHALIDSRRAGGGFEPGDVVQSTFRSFLATVGRGRYEVPDGQDLWALLAVASLNKLRSYRRAAGAAKRTPPGAAALTDTPAPLTATDPALPLAAADLLAQLPPHERELVELRVAGHEVGDIAARVGRSRRSVERILQASRHRLLQLVSADD